LLTSIVWIQIPKKMVIVRVQGHISNGFVALDFIYPNLIILVAKQPLP